jgi:hypothetical protein
LGRVRVQAKRREDDRTKNDGYHYMVFILRFLILLKMYDSPNITLMCTESGFVMAAPIPLAPAVEDSHQARHQSHLWCWLAHDTCRASQRLRAISVQLACCSRQTIQKAIFLYDAYMQKEARE